MTMSDPIADMLTRIRNANTAKHDTVDIPASKIKVAIAGILVDEGFIEKYDIIEDGNFKTIRVTLKYGADKNEKIITGIKRISKPGLRVYAGKDEIPSPEFSVSRIHTVRTSPSASMWFICTYVPFRQIACSSLRKSTRFCREYPFSFKNPLIFCGFSRPLI